MLKGKDFTSKVAVTKADKDAVDATKTTDVAVTAPDARILRCACQKIVVASAM